MQLTLTPDIEAAINERASQTGATPEQLVLESLKKLFTPTLEQEQESLVSLADLLNGYIGVIHSSDYIEGGAQISEETGKAFSQLMVQKRDQEQL